MLIGGLLFSNLIVDWDWNVWLGLNAGKEKWNSAWLDLLEHAF